MIAVDLEGVHGVVGEEMKGLGSSPEEYEKAVEAATIEINAAASALFDNGATDVYVWDNHGGKDNLDFSKIHSRVKKLEVDRSKPRMSFMKDYPFAGLLFIGYHAKEGTLGVLAHTYNSTQNQYLKVNGKQLGEFDFDACFAGEYGAPAIFAAGDDVFLAQALESCPTLATVVTKYAKGRNAAEFRLRVDVEKEIYEKVKMAMKGNHRAIQFTFPCQFEVRYTRMERAAHLLKTLEGQLPDLRYGEDSHVLQVTANGVADLKKFV